MGADDGEDIYDSFHNQEQQLEYAISVDDKDKFVSLFNDGLTSEDRMTRQYYDYRLHRVYCEVCNNCSFNCAAALLNGEVASTVDININFPDGPFGLLPLHCAADTAFPPITELFLFHKARTDIRCLTSDINYFWKLPLNIALQILCNSVDVSQWTPDQSIFKLIIILCLPRKQTLLENIELLAWHTKEFEEEFVRYARRGKIPQLAALLMVARKKLSNHTLTEYGIRRTLMDMLYSKKKVNESVFHLLEVFEKAGDAIGAYVKEEKINITKQQAIAEVIYLLQREGFHLKRQDTDLSDMPWFQLEEDSRLWQQYTDLNEWEMFQHERAVEKFGPHIFLKSGGSSMELAKDPPMDIGMPHFSFSGHRWTGYGESKIRESMVGKISCEKPKASASNTRGDDIFYQSGRGLPVAKLGRSVSTEASNFPIQGKAEAVKLGVGVGRNLPLSKPLSSFGSVIKKLLKHK